jgi:GntR family transcriptional regulator/MocR family aminotransferase
MEPTAPAAAPQSGSVWVNLSIDRSASEPLQRQLYDQIRAEILRGSLLPGTRLPASRLLASEVGCSRNTVLEVVGQLIAEGYLQSVRGSGVYVVRDLPDETPSVTPPAPEIALAKLDGVAPPELSARGRAVAAARLGFRAGRHAAFSPSMPDVSLFPLATWMQLTAQEWRDHGAALLTESDPRGFEPLRYAIAEYVCAARSVACGPDQVIITAGAQQGIDLVARLLLDPGDRAWVEDPGYPAIRELLRAAGAEVVPVPVDADGLTLEGAASAAPRAIAVSPSHQFPTGVTMSLERRFQLLEFAERVGAWIIEDDYDSEFRYEGRPLAALAGLGGIASARVIYVGTFSKMLFPAIRLGFLVVPKHLAARFTRGRVIVDLQPSIFPQPALARFIAEGHLATHVRRMRRMYRQRQEALLEALAAEAGALLTTRPDVAGMHLIAEFTPQLAQRYDDHTAAGIVAQRGVNAQPMSIYYAERGTANGFVLGYACADESALRAAVTTMVAALRA